MRSNLALICAAVLSGCAPTLKQNDTATPVVEAQAAPVPFTRLSGEVTEVTAAQISLRASDGQTSKVVLAPDWLLIVERIIQASDIRPGDFVATANANIDDESGRSLELRVFPPGLRLGEGSRPMSDGNTMTNGTVGEVTDIAGGRVLTVSVPGRERKITLPEDVVVMGQTLGDKSSLRVGSRVRLLARPDAGGVLTSGYIYVGENGAAPPGR